MQGLPTPGREGARQGRWRERHEADVRYQRVTVEFDESQITETDLRREIDKALNHGFLIE